MTRPDQQLPPGDDTPAVKLPPGDAQTAIDGSRPYGLPGWTRSAVDGRWYPPTFTLEEAGRRAAAVEAQLIGADSLTQPLPTVGAQPGGRHQHTDGSWHPDADDGGPCGVDGEPLPDDDVARIRAADARYLAAMHAVQTGVGYLMHRNPGMADPKHLIFGVDSTKVEQAALAALLIRAGIFTLAEYHEAMAEAMETEVRRSEAELSALYHGRKIKLG